MMKSVAMKPFFKTVQVVVELGTQLTNALERIKDCCVVSVSCSFSTLQTETEIIYIKEGHKQTKTGNLWYITVNFFHVR